MTLLAIAAALAALISTLSLSTGLSASSPDHAHSAVARPPPTIPTASLPASPVPEIIFGALGPHALMEGTGIGDEVPVLTYRVQPGDTLAEIARRFDVDRPLLAAENDLDLATPLRPGKMLRVDMRRDAGAHVVQPGDSLSAVAKQHGVDAPYLATANGLAVTSILKPGQALLVPLDRAVPAPSRPQDSSPYPATQQPGQAASSTNAADPGNPTDRRDQSEPASRSGRDIPSLQQDFLLEAAAAAQETQKVTGVPASVTIAQAILESDWGRSTIGGNNYFGIKATSKPGPAGVVWAKTRENTARGWITVSAPFRAYENMTQSFEDHAAFFVENARYADALRHADDPKLFARLIHKAGYATDPNYADLLIKLMDKYDLYAYDSLLTHRTKSW